ncbi:hypothetical protein ABLN97_00375 [Mycobacterium tuberculosis]
MASIVAGVIDPANPGMAGLRRWLGPLSILLRLWGCVRRFSGYSAPGSSAGASAVIADLSGQVLTAVTARRPSQPAAQPRRRRGADYPGPGRLAALLHRLFATLLLVMILTPATVAVIGLYDLEVNGHCGDHTGAPDTDLHGADRAGYHQPLAAALAAMTAVQARLLDLIAGASHPQGAGPCFRPGTTHRGTV